MADYAPGGFTAEEQARNRAVTLAHEKGYKVSSSRGQNWECPDCAAIVSLFGIEKHVEWHEKVIERMRAQLFYSRSSSML